MSSNPGLKHDGEKIRWDLMPFKQLDLVAEIVTFGAEKYAPNSWQEIENGGQRLIAAALRHISLHQQGELYDDESGKTHLAHAACSILMAMHHEVSK